jgi:precorrin-6B methylase 2
MPAEAARFAALALASRAGALVSEGLRRTCRAFRQVRGLAQQAVLDAIDAHPGRAPVIADLAAGPATCLLEAIPRRPEASALVYDIDPAALDQAAASARRLGVENRVRTIRADAFDREALRSLDPKPDVVVELGLYGIYHDDALIERVWRDRRGERCVWRLYRVARLQCAEAESR